MKTILSILVISFLLLASCTDSGRGSRQNTLEFSYDSVLFEADSVSLQFYASFTIDKEDGIFIGYNSKLHALDLFSIEESRFLGRKMLDRQGPDAVSRLRGLYSHSPDSLFLLGLMKIYLLDGNFEIQSTYTPLRAKGMQENKIGFVSASAFGKLLFDPASQSMLFTAHAHEDELTKPIMAAYDLVRDTISFLPIRYPEADFIKGGYGLLKLTNYSVLDDSVLYYGFAYKPGISTYRFAEGISRSYPADPETVRAAGPFKGSSTDFQLMSEHAIKNPMYFEPLLTTDYLLQICEGGQDMAASGTEISSFKDKSWHILVYSRDYTFLGKLDLPVKPYFRNSWFVYKDKLYLCPHPFRFEGTPHDMTSLIFHIVEIQ